MKCSLTVSKSEYLSVWSEHGTVPVTSGDEGHLEFVQWYHMRGEELVVHRLETQLTVHTPTPTPDPGGGPGNYKFFPLLKWGIFQVVYIRIVLKKAAFCSSREVYHMVRVRMILEIKNRWGSKSNHNKRLYYYSLAILFSNEAFGKCVS